MMNAPELCNKKKVTMPVYEETATDPHCELSLIEKSSNFVYVHMLIMHCARWSLIKHYTVKMHNAKLRNHLNTMQIVFCFVFFFCFSFLFVCLFVCLFVTIKLMVILLSYSAIARASASILLMASFSYGQDCTLKLCREQ